MDRRSVYSIDLASVVNDFDTWVVRNIPKAACFIDWSTVLPEVLEVAFGLTPRKQFVCFDPLGMRHWGLPIALRLQFCEFMVSTLEEYLLKIIGERPGYGGYSYRVTDSTLLYVMEVGF